MSTLKTRRLGLPQMVPAQASKHIVHNEALERLDCLVQLTVSGVLNTPPSITNPDTVVAIGANPTSEFSDHAGRLAHRRSDDWAFIEPKIGWRALNLASGEMLQFDGATWVTETIAESVRVEHIGVGTDADETLGLSVRSSASLFEGDSGHQIKLNRSLPQETASLLFTTAHQGEAEIGLTGNPGFNVKTSPDGANFTLALTVDSEGTVDAPIALSRSGHPVWDAGNAPGLLIDRGIISNGTDLNTLTETGRYFQSSNYGAQTGFNYPRPQAGTLTVRESSFDVQQTYRLYGGAANGEGDAIFVRSFYANLWRPWRKQLSELA